MVTVVQATQQLMRRRDPLRKYIDIVCQYAEAESPIKPSNVAGPSGSIDMDTIAVDDLEYGTSVKGLANLRRRLKRAVSVFRGTQKQYCSKVLQVQELEEICKSRRTRDYSPRAPMPRFVWIYKCLIRPWVLRLVALALAAVSVCVIFAEATIGAGRHPDLSPFSIMVHHKANRAEIGLQLLALLPLVYMCTCTYYSLFKLGIFSSYYFMVPGCTSAFSLLVNAALMCRFAPPLCYNFMHIIHVDDFADGQGEATTFAKKMASMDLIPLLGSKFNTWFPLVLVVYCGALALAVLTGCSCLDALVPGRLRFDKDEPDDEHSERGRVLLRKEQEARAKGMPVGSALSLDAMYGSSALQSRAELGRPPASAASVYRGTAQGTSARSPSHIDPGAEGGHRSPAAPVQRGRGRGWWPWGESNATNEQSLLPTGPSSTAMQAGRISNSTTNLDNIFASLKIDSGGQSSGRIDDEPFPSLRY